MNVFFHSLIFIFYKGIFNLSKNGMINQFHYIRVLLNDICNYQLMIWKI